MSSSSPADDSQNAPKKNTEAPPGILKFFKSLGKTNSDECAEHVKSATFSALGTPKQKEKIAPKTRKKSKNVPRVTTRSRRRVKPAARNAKKPKVSRGSSEGADKDSVYDILDISDDAEEVTIIEYSEFLKQQQISKETKNDSCGNAKVPAEETVTEPVPTTAPVSVITGYFKPISEEPRSEGKAKRPSGGKVKVGELSLSSRPKRACTMLRNSFDAIQQEMLLEMFDRKARRNLCKVDVLESQHPMRLRHKRDSFEQYFVPPEEEPTKSPRSSKHKKKKRSKSQSEVAQTMMAEHENTNEVYTSTIIEERSDFKCPRLRITRVSKDHDDTVKDPADDLDAQDIIASVKEEELEVARVTEARASFLQSGIPEKLRRETDAANAVLEDFIRDSAYFPTVSHVKQLTDDVMWTLPTPEMGNLRMRTTSTAIATVTGKLELGSLTQCKRSERWQAQPAKPFDAQQVLTTLQQEHPKLAIAKIFERYQHRTGVLQNSQIANSGTTEEVDRIPIANNKGKMAARGKRSRGTARPNSKRNSVNATDLNNQHVDVAINSSSTVESSLMWTDKFQPEGAVDIIGNDRAVQELRSWLHHWKQKPRQDEPTVRVAKRKRTDSATDEDYVADEFCHAQLLIGPCGIGKTATVYALANEIGFEVIEVNASSKRAGKQVLSQLQEATQSHNVNNGPSCDSQGIANYFQKVNNRAAVNCEQQDKINLKKKYPMGSLILFKDVDIVFEEDEGFINAVNSFIDISKRPIIMTTSDQRFVIANRLSAIHEEIRFEVPNWDIVILHMQLMSLAEGLHVPAEELMSTTPPWKIDIRHAILNLQYRYMSAMKPQIPEATVIKEPAGNAQRRRKRPTKQHAVQSPPTDPPVEDASATRWQLPRDAELQMGRILTLTTGKPLVTDNIVGVCWSSGINFTMAPSKHVLEHQDGTNNTSPGDSVRVDGKRKAAASSTLLSEFADSASALDVIQWQSVHRQTQDVVTQASRDFIRPGTSDVTGHDSESWCAMSFGQDISAYLRTLNWENFCKVQRDDEESRDGVQVHMQWTRDTLQTQISKARKDVGVVVKHCALQASHALDLDYMPWLKVICRAEGIRHVSNKKRGGGRYLHYLDSINLSLQPGTLSHLTNS